MEQKILNSDMLKELTGEQACDLITKFRCLACVFGKGKPCGISGLDIKCVQGYSAWLDAEADPENWKNIRDALGIPPVNE